MTSLVIGWPVLPPPPGPRSSIRWFSGLTLPEMLKYGYSKAISLGCIAASGTFAAMIPPSLTMVIYAIITEQSIGKLLLAGVFPGLLSAFLYAVLILGMVRLKPSISPRTLPEKIHAQRKIEFPKGCLGNRGFGDSGPGRDFSGMFPPSAAGAVGAFGTFLIALMKLGLKDWILESLGNSAAVACTIFTILIGGLIFSRLLVITGVISQFVDFIAGAVQSKGSLLALFSIMYIVLGCYLDTASVMVIILPFVFPVIVKFGIDPIWFGIIFVKLIEISVITPPVGLNLYAVMSGAGKDADSRSCPRCHTFSYY